MGQRGLATTPSGASLRPGDGRALKKQNCDKIVTNPPHCTGLSYQMSWEQQRRIELRRIRVAEDGTVYSKQEEAFYLATQLGWTREQFMLLLKTFPKAEKILKIDEGKKG